MGLWDKANKAVNSASERASRSVEKAARNTSSVDRAFERNHKKMR